MRKHPCIQTHSKIGTRILSVALCVALGSFGIVPAASAAGEQGSTTFAQEEQEQVDGANQDGTSTDAADEQGSDKQQRRKGSSAKKQSSSFKSASKKEQAAQIKKKARERAKLATAKEAIAEVNELAARMETAYEDLAQEQNRLKKLKKEIKQTKKDIRNTDAKLDQTRQRVSQWAKATYISGGVRYMSVLLGATSFGDFVSRLDFMNSITAEEERLVKKIKQLKSDLSESNELLVDKYSEQKSLTASVSANANVIQNSLIEQANYFAALPAKIRKKVLAYDGVANSLSAAAGMTGSTSKKGSHPGVVKMALKYLGVKYVWGGDDPSGFDCSGLTMYVYKKVTGKNLTHFARTQYSEGTKIAKSALMPGDLVFFGETVEGIHHVGIYMGNDKFIHAPHTGDVVKISTLSSRSDYIGACRP